MSDVFDEIDMNLDDVPDKFGLIPVQDTSFRVLTATRKNKDGEQYLTSVGNTGKWPYVEIICNPISSDPDIASKELMVVASFNPKALFNMKELRTAMGMPTNISAKALMLDVSTDEQYIGKTFGCTPQQVPSQKDPMKKVMRMDRPYRSAR